MMENKILLVDDEKGIRKVLSISLADLGYIVFTANSGEQAISILDEVVPQIVITDIKMPGMTGIELLKHIKKKNPETEVIMLSGHKDIDLAIDSLKFDATDFITKPVRDDVLEVALKRANEKISMRRQIKDYTENLENMVREKSASVVEHERMTAVGQAIDQLSSFFNSFSDNLNDSFNVFNEMPCFVSVHDPDLNIVSTNSLYKKRLGDAKNRKSWELYQHKKDTKKQCPVSITFKLNSAQKSKETIHYQGKNILVLVYTAPIRNIAGEIQLVIEIAVDITEIDRLREELKITQNRYQNLFEEVPCYVSLQNRDLKIVAANRYFKDNLGEGEGLYCYEVYKNRKSSCPECPVLMTFEDGKSHQTEMLINTKNNKRKNLLISTSPIKDAAGNIFQVIEMATDITELYKMQSQLSSLGLLIGSISHSIKGMLTGLDGGMYKLNMGLEKQNSDQIDEGWTIVKLIVGRIRSMILDILYYAKERELTLESVDLVEFSRDITYLMRPKIEKHNIILLESIDTDLNKIEIDPTIVRSALVNIIENAIDACNEDTLNKKHEISFNVSRDEEVIIFTVSDNGTGMNQTTQDSLFKLFFSSKGTKGTGLGLYISKKIINQHNGTIEVKSSPGKGTCFIIKIPIVARITFHGKNQ